MKNFLNLWIEKFLDKPLFFLEKWISKVVVIFLILMPLAFTFKYSYTKLKETLTEVTLDRRQALATLAASAIREKLEDLINLGRSFVIRPVFYSLVKQGKWTEAMERLKSVPDNFPEIDQILLADVRGEIQAGESVALKPGEPLFSSEKWFESVRKNWKPYVSGVYSSRTALPYSLIDVAVPIQSGADNPLGILVLQVRVESLLSWIEKIEVGPSGFIYVVDHKGRLVLHPKFTGGSKIFDFSTVPAVKRVLLGKRGVVIAYNPIEKEERISAFEPVAPFQWGVIAQQPTRTAFLSRDLTLKGVLLVFCFIFILGCIFVALLIYSLSVVNRQQREVETALAQVKTLKGLIPICSECKKIRDDKGYWHQVEVYVRQHSEADFTHGVCPECMKELYPKQYKKLYPGPPEP